MTQQPLFTKDYLLCTLTNFLVMVNYYVLMVIMTDYTLKNYQVSLGTAGLSASIFIVGAMVSRLFSGATMERWGRTRLLKIFLVVNLIMSLSYFWVKFSVVLLMGVRIIHGISYGVLSTALGTLVSHAIPKKRSGEGIGYYMLSVTLAAAIGPFLGFSLYNQGGYNLLFIVCCVIIAASLAGSFFLTPQPPTQSAASHSKLGFSLKTFFEPKAFRVSTFTATIYFGYSALLAFLATYASHKNLSEVNQFFFVVYALAIFVSRPLTGPLFDRKGEVACFLPAFLSFSIGMGLLGWSPNAFVLLLSAAFLGFGVGVSQSTGLASAIRKAPDYRLAVVNSTFYIFLDTAVGLGPLIMGSLMPLLHISYSQLYYILGGFTLIVLLFYLGERSQSVRKQNRF